MEIDEEESKRRNKKKLKKKQSKRLPEDPARKSLGKALIPTNISRIDQRSLIHKPYPIIFCRCQLLLLADCSWQYGKLCCN